MAAAIHLSLFGATMEDGYFTNLPIQELVYGIHVRVQLKYEFFRVKTILGLKQFFIWIFISLVMVNFVIRDKSVISVILVN